MVDSASPRQEQRLVVLAGLIQPRKLRYQSPGGLDTADPRKPRLPPSTFPAAPLNAEVPITGTQSTFDNLDRE